MAPPTPVTQADPAAAATDFGKLYADIAAEQEAPGPPGGGLPPAITKAAAANIQPRDTSTGRRALELGGAGAAGAAALALARRPGGLVLLRDLVARHPITGAAAVGGGAGAVAATPEAIEHGDPSDILLGAGTGMAGGILGGKGARGLARIPDLLSTSAADRAISTTAMSDFTAQNAATRLRQLSAELRSGSRGPNPDPRSVGDVLGPQGQALEAGALRTPSPALASRSAELDASQAAAPGRVAETINQALAPTDYNQAEQDLIKNLKTNAAPLYDTAYKQFQAVPSKVLMDVLDTPEGQAASKYAAEEMRKLGLPIGPTGPGGMATSYSLQYLDLVKQSLDGDVSGLRRAAKMGNASGGDVRRLTGLRDRYVDELDELTGGDQSPYLKARQQYQSDAKVLDALHEGRDEVFGDSNKVMTPAQLQARMMTMGSGLSAEKDAFLSGVAENLFRQLGKVRASGNPAARISGLPDAQAKLRLLFDDPRDADEFLARLDVEDQVYQRTKGLQTAAGQGAAAAVAPKSGTGAKMLDAAMHIINPKLAALRAGMEGLNIGKLPAAAITRTMSQTGAQGANELSRLSTSLERLRRGMSAADTAGAVGATVGGAGAGAGTAALAEQGQQ